MAPGHLEVTLRRVQIRHKELQGSQLSNWDTGAGSGQPCSSTGAAEDELPHVPAQSCKHEPALCYSMSLKSQALPLPLKITQPGRTLSGEDPPFPNSSTLI